jgi:hypothetical protein
MFLTFSFFFCSCVVCGAYCNSCPTNGAGKCDPGQCATGYLYVSGTTSCAGIRRHILFNNLCGTNTNSDILSMESNSLCNYSTIVVFYHYYIMLLKLQYANLFIKRLCYFMLCSNEFTSQNYEVIRWIPEANSMAVKLS